MSTFRPSCRLLAAIVLVSATSPIALAQTSRPDTAPGKAPPASQPASRPAGDEANPPAKGFDVEGSDAEAITIADRVMQKMGGRAAWDETRYLSWTFFGSRRHVWDRHTGDIRIEGKSRETDEPYVIIMNIHDKAGHVWVAGERVTDEERLANFLKGGLGAWINDSYWLVMPYKLKDSGVTLKHLGERAMTDGRAADALELTFKDVGNTPQNKYHVYVGRESGLVEQWDFYATVDEEKPRFQIPWGEWKRHGRILLSADRGERDLSDVAVHDALPPGLFSDPAVTLPKDG